MLETDGAVVCCAVATALDGHSISARLALAAGVPTLDPLQHLRAFLA
jgi:hypothetical protein